MLRKKLHIYEHGERAGKLLSHHLRQSISNNLISEIREKSGQIETDHVKRNTKNIIQTSMLPKTPWTPPG